MYTTKNIHSDENPEFTRIMLDLFIKTSLEFIEELKLALNYEDLIKINQLAHRIKPSVEIMEIESVVPLIHEIEDSSTINDALRNKIHLTLHNLALTIGQIKKELQIPN